jgi:uncharacterized protein YgfB (UPF0149 family)
MHNCAMATPNFDEIEHQLGAARALADLPEAHGTLAGALCGSNAWALTDWLREVFTEGQAGAAESSMASVYEWTRYALDQGGLEFQLLLPDDESAVADRAQALGEWCQGFLYGLGSNPLPQPEHLSTEAAEIIHDLTAITQVGIDTEASVEDNEQAYTELVEFVRVGVQLLFEELADYRNMADPSARDDGQPLH